MLSKEALKKIEESLVYYRYVLLVNDEKYELEPADFHFTLSDLLLNEESNVAIEMFRESGKSSFALRAFPLYCLTHPAKERDYIVLLKGNQRSASSKLREIIAEYETNPLLRHNTVEIKERSMNAFSVDVKDKEGNVINVRIEAYGKGSAIRGLSNNDRRPKIIIADDIQDKEDARSDTVVETDWEWFLSDVYFLGRVSRIFLIGNNLGERCILERVINSADELSFKALRVPVLKDDGSPAWPAKDTVESIEREKRDFSKLGKLDVWYAEKMCQAVSEEGRIFKEADFLYYEHSHRESLLRDCSLYCCVDPASSTNPESCLRAITLTGVDVRNMWYVLDVKYGRWDSSLLLDHIFGMVREYNLYSVGIEKGIFKQVLEPFIMQEQRKRNIFFNVLPLEHGKVGSKLERIKLLQPRFKAHSIFIPREEDAAWVAELKAELAGVTNYEIKSKYIDVVDALAMTTQIAKPPIGKAKTRVKKWNGSF